MTEPVADPTMAHVNAALARALAAPELAGVYLSPGWPLTGGDGTPSPGWKRSILLRVPGRGAVHWGHLFLLIRAEARPLGPSADALLPSSTGGPPIIVEWPDRPAGETGVWVQPRMREPCERFAHRLRQELARAIPETS